MSVQPFSCHLVYDDSHLFPVFQVHQYDAISSYAVIFAQILASNFACCCSFPLQALQGMSLQCLRSHHLAAKSVGTHLVLIDCAAVYCDFFETHFRAWKNFGKIVMQICSRIWDKLALGQFPTNIIMAKKYHNVQLWYFWKTGEWVCLARSLMHVLEWICGCLLTCGRTALSAQGICRH